MKYKQLIEGIKYDLEVGQVVRLSKEEGELFINLLYQSNVEAKDENKDQPAQGKITKRQEQLLHLFAELIDKLKSQLDRFALGVLDRNPEKFKILVPFWLLDGSKLDGEMTNLSVQGIKVEINYRDEIVLFTPLAAIYAHEYSVIIKLTANKNTDNPAFQEIIDKFFEFHFPDLPEESKLE